MSRKKTHHGKQFKLYAVNYRKEHPDLTQIECAKNLETGVRTLAHWEAQFRDNNGNIPTIGSGFYESGGQREIARLKRDLRDAQDALDVLKKAAVKKQIQHIYDGSNQNYGAPKITSELRKSGEHISQRTVGKYMRKMGIKAQWVEPWTTTTRDSDFSKELHNILDEQFNPDRPNAVWCTDITYIWTTDGFVYLNCIMDLYSRKIIAWTLADTLEVSTVISTINKAKASRNTDMLFIIHTDRRCQYVSKTWRPATEGMTRSYSHTGCPYDNACIESFHSLIKRKWLNFFTIRDYRHAYSLVFECIETFYT